MAWVERGGGLGLLLMFLLPSLTLKGTYMMPSNVVTQIQIHEMITIYISRFAH